MSQQTELIANENPPVILNTAHAREMLRKRFAPPEWTLMEEVAPATGGGTRYADAVAMNLWRSRGHQVVGFEIKASRGDWLRELKQPEKAEDVYQYCDQWWIVAPRGIVKEGELPVSWGLFELRDSGVVQVKAAPKLEPDPLTREFIASMMRRGHEQINSIAERLQRLAVVEARNEIDNRIQEEIERRTRRFKELAEKVAEFEKQTGLRIDHYSGPPIETVQLAQRLENLRTFCGDGPLSKLVQIAQSLERAAADVRKAIDESGLHTSES
jgi:hypothetical protein